ncbi:MAG: hypothetical protein ABF713_09985 [Acetobacter orientalis]|uniref:hypothetical protein n=1 Tax=Acetobacter orientalis TaxID=146474 RepID=UPI000AEC0078|nr:hypothetical protein [Acetobacter orientalis]
MQPVQWGMAMLARNLVTLQCMGSQLGYAKGGTLLPWAGLIWRVCPPSPLAQEQR